MEDSSGIPPSYLNLLLLPTEIDALDGALVGGGVEDTLPTFLAILFLHLVQNQLPFFGEWHTIFGCQKESISLGG